MALTLLVLLENKKLIQFLDKKRTQGAISEFCSAQNIEWKFIPNVLLTSVVSGKQLSRA